MSELSSILWRYAALERETQNFIFSRCAKICEFCASCCCRADICKEALESAFLRRLHGQTPNSANFSDHHGWLTEKGCGIVLGRPPVCYEFFCDELIENLPTPTHRYVLTTLGKLVSHIGKKADGVRHLIEITKEEDLECINKDHFLERLSEAQSALEHIRYFYDNGELEYDALEQLGKIAAPPEAVSA